MMLEAAELGGADLLLWILDCALVRRVRRVALAAGLHASLLKVCRKWKEGA